MMMTDLEKAISDIETAAGMLSPLGYRPGEISAQDIESAIHDALHNLALARNRLSLLQRREQTDEIVAALAGGDDAGR